MRVLYLINYAGNGGTEKYVENLVRRFHPDRAECFFCFNVDGPLADRMREAGVTCFQLEMKHPFDRRAAKKLAGFCRENGIDVIHAQYPRENYIALLSKKYYPVPEVIFTSHLSISQNAVWKALNRRMMKKNRYVIAVCEAGKDILVSNGVPADRIRVIYNGITPGDPPAPRLPGRERPALGEKLPDGAVAAITLARLEPEKGLPFLIDSVELAARKTGVPIFLYIAGDGSEKAALEEKNAADGAGGRVKLLGFRSDGKDLLCDSDIFVNSSENEAMSFAILEALASGLPLVATRVGGNTELVEENGECGIAVGYGDVEAYSDALAKLAEDAGLRARYSEAARRKAETCFDLEKLTDALYELYKK